MKDTTTAIYHGKEYDASLRVDGTITLISNDQETVENGFVLYKGIAYIKRVSREDVTELFKVVNSVEYQGYTSELIEEQEGKILIQIRNLLTADAKRLSMDYATDKGIYVKWVDKSDVEISEKKISL